MGSKTPLMLAFGLEHFEPDIVFEKWPKHVTLVPWFNGVRRRQLTEELHELTQRTKPIAVHLGGSAMFGARGDVPVRLIEPNERLQQFHTDVLLVVSDAGADYGDIGGLGYKYQPHVTNRAAEPLQPDYVLSSLALVSDVGRMRRRVDEVFELHG